MARERRAPPGSFAWSLKSWTPSLTLQFRTAATKVCQMNALVDHDYLCYARAASEGWRAYCVDLDLDVKGRTLSEAQRRLQDAIARRLEALEAQRAETSDDDADKPVVWTVPHPFS